MSYSTAPNLGASAPRLATQYPAQSPGSFAGAGGPTTAELNIILLSADFRPIDLAWALLYLGVATNTAVSELESQIADLEQRVAALEA